MFTEAEYTEDAAEHGYTVAEVEEIAADFLAECLAALEGEAEGEPVYMGTVFTICPSGKYGSYPVDHLFWDTFDRLASEHGIEATSGEFDPCDVYAYRWQ